MLPQPSLRLAIGVVFSTIVIFIGDILTPLGYAETILYLLPLLLSSFLYEPRLPFRLAGTCTLLIVAGFALSPPGAPAAYAVLNRILAVITLWTVAFGLRRLIRDRIAHFQAEQRWQLLARQTNDILWDWDLRTNTHWWSENAVAVVGYDPVREPSIEAWQSRLHPKDRSHVLQDIQSAIENGQSGWTGEYQFQVLDGTFRTFLDRGTIIRNGSGSAIRMIGAMIDITSQKHLQTALRQSEERLALAAEGSTDAWWDGHRLPERTMLDPENPIWWSPKIRDILALNESDPFHTLAHWAQRLHPDDSSQVFAALQEHLQQQAPFDVEYRIRTNRGDFRWLRGRGRAIRDLHGEPRRMAGSCQDITDRKIAEEALRRSEAQLKEAQRIAGLGSWEWTAESVVTWSDETYRIFGYHPRSVLPSYDLFVESVHPDDRRQVVATLRETLTPGTLYDLACRILRPSGEARHIRCRGEVTRDGTGVPLRVTGTVEDITDRHVAEAKLRIAYTRLQDVTRQSATVEENERRRIAREIHDELGQLLTAMRFQLTSLKKSRHSHASRKATPDDNARLNDLLHLNDSMLKQVRDLSTSLRPAILDKLGLIPAVQAHAQQFEVRTGIACDVVVDPALGEVSFDDATASAVFRIVQELLTNVLRHAHAMAVSISLIRTRDLLTVAVHDNGTGITPSHQTRHDSFGLKGITERALLLGGAFTITPHPSEGTVATLHIPLAVSLPLLSAVTACSPLSQEGHENPVG